MQLKRKAMLPTVIGLTTKHAVCCKVRKTARIRNQYNQEPHLSQDTKSKSNKITINITNKSQEVSSLPSVKYKAAMNRRESMTNTNINNVNDQQKKHCLGTVSKNILLEGLTCFTAPKPHPRFRCESRHIYVWFA